MPYPQDIQAGGVIHAVSPLFQNSFLVRTLPSVFYGAQFLDVAASGTLYALIYDLAALPADGDQTVTPIVPPIVLTAAANTSFAPTTWGIKMQNGIAVVISTTAVDAATHQVKQTTDATNSIMIAVQWETLDPQLL